jgi:hypothetical protein
MGAQRHLIVWARMPHQKANIKIWTISKMEFQVLHSKIFWSKYEVKDQWLAAAMVNKQEAFKVKIKSKVKLILNWIKMKTFNLVYPSWVRFYKSNNKTKIMETAYQIKI